MAILTKAQLQADNSASFADNNTQAITPAILRSYNANIIDTLVDSLDTGSFATTSSFNTASLNTATASFTPRISNLESKSASVDITLSSINSKTGSYATTGSNTFFGTQTYSGSVYIANDLIVLGSSSIQ